MSDSAEKRPADEQSKTEASGARASGGRSAGSHRHELPTGIGLGKYRILERIRKSHNSIVYKARDNTLDRLVCVKQMTPRLIDDPIACGNFRRQAQLMARIPADARHLVRIFEMIEDDHGLFIVQEYAEGRWLDALIAKRHLDAASALRIFGTLALGLRSLHLLGVVQRNLRPGVVMAERERGAKITDFDAAAPEGETTSPTWLDVKYAAPELLGTDDFDDRVDIYSLGFIMYEMCVGRPRLHRYVSASLGLPEGGNIPWRQWHLDRTKQLPSAEVLNPTIPETLSMILGRMLAKEPLHRIGSIDETIALLAGFLRERRQASSRRLTAGGERRPVPHMYRLPSASQVGQYTRSVPAAGSLSSSVPMQPQLGVSLISRVGSFPGAPGQLGIPGQIAQSWAMVHVPASTRKIAVPKMSQLPPAQDAFHTMSVERPKPERRRSRRQPTLRGRPPRAPLAVPVPEPVKETVREHKPGFRKRVFMRMAGGLLLAALGAGTLWWYTRPLHPLERLMRDAEAAYDSRQYETAEARYAEAAALQVEAPRLKALRSDAGRLLVLVSAAKALNDGLVDEAEALLKEADGRGANRAKIEALREQIVNQRRRLAVRAEVDAAMDAGEDPAQVEMKLDRLRAQGDQDSVDAAAIQDRLDRSKGLRQQASLIEQARTALNLDDFRAAQVACSEAEAIETSDNDAVRQLKRQISERKQRYELVLRGNAAMQDGDYEAAASNFDEANRLSPSAEIEEKAQQAHAHLLLREAEEAIKSGNLLIAEEKLRSAQWQAKLPEVAAKLELMESAFDAAHVVRDADRAAKIGDFEEAIRLFERALVGLPAPIDPRLSDGAPADPATSDRDEGIHACRSKTLVSLSRARRGWAMQRGDKAAIRQEWEAALEAFQEARNIEVDGEVTAKIREAEARLGKKPETQTPK